MHELGRRLDKTLVLKERASLSAGRQSGATVNELIAAGREVSKDGYTDEQVCGEGMAQFLMFLTSNEAEARAKFPKFYGAFLDAIEKAPPGTSANVQKCSAQSQPQKPYFKRAVYEHQRLYV